MLARYETAIVFDLPPGWTKWEGHIFDTKVRPIVPGTCDSFIKQGKTKLIVAGEGWRVFEELSNQMVALFPGVSWKIYKGPEDDEAIKKHTT